MDAALYMDDTWLETVLYALLIALEMVDLTLFQVADVCDLMAFQVLLILLRSVRNEDAPNVTMLLQVFDSHVLVFVQAVTVLLYILCRNSSRMSGSCPRRWMHPQKCCPMYWMIFP